MKGKLYKLAIWYIGKCNEVWNKPIKDLSTSSKLTYRIGKRAYLFHGADAEWRNFRCYDVLDNAIQKLAEYEEKERQELYKHDRADFDCDVLL